MQLASKVFVNIQAFVSQASSFEVVPNIFEDWNEAVTESESAYCFVLEHIF